MLPLRCGRCGQKDSGASGPRAWAASQWPPRATSVCVSASHSRGHCPHMAWHCRPTGPRRLGVSGPACVQAWTPDTRAAGAAASAHLSWTVTPRVGAVLRVGAPGSRAGARPAGHRSRLPAAGLTSIPTWTACAQSCLLGLGVGLPEDRAPWTVCRAPAAAQGPQCRGPAGTLWLQRGGDVHVRSGGGVSGAACSFTPSRPWSCRGPCGGLTRRGRCAPGRPPHSPSRGLAIGRAVTAPRKEQWVSLARPRSPGRTASLSQEPWAVWHRRSPGQPSPASLAQCVGVAGAPPVRTSVLHRVAVGWPRPHRVAHRSRPGNPSARGWARGSRVASHARRVTVPSRGTRGHRLHGLVAPRRHAQREKPTQRAARGSAGSRCSQPGRGRWAGRSVSVAPCRRTGSDDSPSLCHS